jgi:hypothetical protein
MRKHTSYVPSATGITRHTNHLTADHSCNCCVQPCCMPHKTGALSVNIAWTCSWHTAVPRRHKLTCVLMWSSEPQCHLTNQVQSSLSLYDAKSWYRFIKHRTGSVRATHQGRQKAFFHLLIQLSSSCKGQHSVRKAGQHSVRKAGQHSVRKAGLHRVRKQASTVSGKQASTVSGKQACTESGKQACTESESRPAWEHY